MIRYVDRHTYEGATPKVGEGFQFHVFTPWGLSSERVAFLAWNHRELRIVTRTGKWPFKIEIRENGKVICLSTEQRVIANRSYSWQHVNQVYDVIPSKIDCIGGAYHAFRVSSEFHKCYWQRKFGDREIKGVIARTRDFPVTVSIVFATMFDWESGFGWGGW